MKLNYNIFESHLNASIKVNDDVLPLNHVAVPFHVGYIGLFDRLSNITEDEYAFLNKYFYWVIDKSGHQGMRVVGLIQYYSPDKMVKILLKTIDILSGYGFTILNEEKFLKIYGRLYGERTIGDSINIFKDTNHSIITITPEFIKL